MAEKLMLYYKYVTEQAGFAGKMQLAMATKVPTTRAALAPDSPDNIALFREEITKITGKPAPLLP